jgi:hypothetical protein
LQTEAAGLGLSEDAVALTVEHTRLASTVKIRNSRYFNCGCIGDSYDDAEMP